MSRLTGKTRHRMHKPLFGSPVFILQVEREYFVFENVGNVYIDGDHQTRWEDATFSDLQEIKKELI